MIVRAAAVQAAPVFLDKRRTVEKGVRLTREAAANGARLVVFPETWIPTFPYWAAGFPSGHPGREQLFGAYERLWEQSVLPDESDLGPLMEAARSLQVTIVVGINERDPDRGRTLYNTNVYINERGEIAGKHRKLVPTLSERLIWGSGDGSTLTVVDTAAGKVGGLICYENTMPLARYALYAKGEQIHVANFPGYAAIVPQVDLLGRTIAFEGQVFVIVACGVLRPEDIPADFPARDLAAAVRTAGGSAIIGPDGRYLAGPAVDRDGPLETILYADLDLAAIVRAKAMVDVVGHYARPDVFQLTVNESPRPMLTVTRN